jgi:hypothetical protein
VSSSAQAKVNTVRALLAGHTDRKEEKQILALVKGASKAKLSQLITALSLKEMHELISDLNDRLLGPDHQTAFVELISKDRVGALTIDARGMFIQTSARARPGRPAGCADSSALFRPWRVEAVPPAHFIEGGVTNGVTGPPFTTLPSRPKGKARRGVSGEGLLRMGQGE